MTKILADQATFQAAMNEFVFADTSERTCFAVTGADRIKMLQGFCTADLKKLEAGQGTEAFILNPKGKILGFVRFFNFDDELLVDSEPGQAETLIAHLDRYVIVEDVQFSGQLDQTRQLTFSGPKSVSWLRERLKLSEEFVTSWMATDAEEFKLRCLSHEFEGNVFQIFQNQTPKPDSLTVQGEAAAINELEAALDSAKVVRCDPMTREALRVYYGMPAFGVDVTDANLPQELVRDRRAISFTKGCYLGQETVARIDALGHVNRLFVQLECQAGEPLDVGADLDFEGKNVGSVTSSAWNPVDNTSLALGYVRRGHHAAGTELGCNGQVVRVKDGSSS